MSTRGPNPDPVPSDRLGTALEKNPAGRVFTQAETDALTDSLLEGIEGVTSLERVLAERAAKNLLIAAYATEQAQGAPFIQGSRKQLIENPGFRVAARCESAALQIVRALALDERRGHAEPELDNLLHLARQEVRRKDRKP